MMTISEIVAKLTGSIYPIGETRADEKSYEALQDVVILVNKLLYDLEEVAEKEGSPEYSINRSGKYAKEFLAGVKEWLNDMDY